MHRLAVVVAILAYVLLVDYAYKRRAPGTLRTYCSNCYALALAPINAAIAAASQSVDVFPDLATHFPTHTRLTDNWKIIRDEALCALTNDAMTHIKGDMFFERIADDKWKKLYLRWHGPITHEARTRCPRTCALLDDMPEVRIAMFSVLEPGARITPHRGPFRGCVRYHLGLQCPPAADACFINVDGTPYTWQDGVPVLFDDTYVHYVQNGSSTQCRVILFCDVDRRLKWTAAQHVLGALVDTFGPLTSRANAGNEVVQAK